MKKYSLLLAMLLCFFVSTIKPEASCTDMAKEAEKIVVRKENYVPDELEYDEKGIVIPTTFVGIAIDKMTEDFYAVVTSDEDDDVITIRYADTENGFYKIQSHNYYRNVNFEVKFYSTDSTKCNSTDAIRKVDIQNDILNQYLYTNKCIEEPSLEICGKFKNTNKLDVGKFEEEFDKQLEEKNKSVFDKLLDFVKNYWIFILVPIVIISVIYITRIILIKREMAKHEK